ncbi:MAG TPA: hypothetical protein PLZ57_04660 [Pseudobdellovibrionaceae bacterium]|nr:hypothetical protein [Pseudobdellovibrionaceae bacterium]
MCLDFIDIHFTYALGLRLGQLKIAISEITETRKLSLNGRSTGLQNSRSTSLRAVLSEKLRQPNVKISAFGSVEI